MLPAGRTVPNKILLVARRNPQVGGNSPGAMPVLIDDRDSAFRGNAGRPSRSPWASRPRIRRDAELRDDEDARAFASRHLRVYRLTRPGQTRQGSDLAGVR